MTKQTNCSIVSCDNKPLARGWCSKHYQRWKNNGDPEVVTVRIKDTMCQVVDCGEHPKIVRGYCLKHYQMLVKNGDPQRKVKSGPNGHLTDEERFLTYVEKSEGCWEWVAYRNKGGYGTFRVSGQMFLAHRYAYYIKYGGELSKLPEYLDHVCHNRGCVNPAHLRAVSKKQNAENRSGPTRANKSGYRGVSWNKQRGKWHGSVRHNQKTYYAGLFVDVEDANRAVLALRNKLFTHNELDNK